MNIACQLRKSPKSMANMHRGVFSSIGEPPLEIGVYLGVLIVIWGFLLSVRELCRIGAAAFWR